MTARSAAAAVLASVLGVSVSGAPPRQASEKPRLVAQVGHGPSVALAFSPDGRWLAAAEAAGGVRLWDVAARRELRQLLSSEETAPTAVAFSPDGHTVVAGLASRAGSLLTAADPNTGAIFQQVTQSKEDIRAVQVSPTGTHVAAGDAAGSVCIWSFPQLTRERCVALDAGRPAFYGISLRFSTDGRTLTARQEKRLKTWDVRTGSLLRDSGARNPQGVEWQFLGMSSIDPIAILGSGQVSDVDTGETIARFSRPRDATTTVAFAPGKQHALLAGAEGSITLLDLKSGDGRVAQVECDGCGFRRAIDSAAFAPDGRTVVTAGKDHVLRLWDVESLEVIGTFAAALMAPRALTFSAAGDRLIVATRSAAIVWSLADGREEARLPYPPTDEIPEATFSPAGNLALTIANGTAAIWNVSDWRRLRTIELRRSGNDPGEWIGAISPNETLLLAADEESASLFRVVTGERVGRFSPPSGMRIVSAAFRPDGSQVVLTTLTTDVHTAKGWHGETHVWTIATDRARRVSEDRQVVWQVQFVDDGRTVITAGKDQPVRFRNVDSWEELGRHSIGAIDLAALRSSRDGNRLLMVSSEGAVVWERNGFRPTRTFAGIGGSWGIDLSADGRWLAGRVEDGVHVWNIASADPPPAMYSFADGSWAVADAQGRYDAADPNRSPGLHWVLGNEVIELGQLKTQFYTRGLLARSLRGETLLDVGGGIGALAPRPLVNIRPPTAGATELHVTLTDAGGGLGPVTVLVNGKALPERFVPPDPRPPAPVEFAIPLTGAVWLPGVENDVEVVVENAVDRVPTRPRGLKVTTAPAAASPAPSFYALLVGTGEFPFASGDLNLRYPAQDARAMAAALRVGATRLVGAERVHITVLTSDAADRAARSTKQNIVRELDRVATAAGARDTVLVFLAGHGLAHGREYFYLTQDATSADLTDPSVRASRALGSGELEHWLKVRIRALKYVVILDTCAAGAAAPALAGLAARASNDDAQVRAIAQLKDATGSFVLMGSAADKASYEASQYGQGLLTYALLQAMRGELALQDGNYLMAADWLTYAVKRVRDLSRDIGRIQEPELSAPGASKNFQVARLLDEDKIAIPVAQPRAQVLRVICVDPTDADPDELEPLVRASLRGLTRGGSAVPVVYLDNVVSDLPGGFVPRIRYTRAEGGWQATVRILRSNKVVHTAQLRLPADKSRAAAQIADAIVQAVAGAAK